MSIVADQPSHEMFNPGDPSVRPVSIDRAPEPILDNRELDSREMSDAYFALRAQAMEVEKPVGEELRQIQEHVSTWLAESFGDVSEPGTVEDYCTYDREFVEAKLGGLSAFLKEHYPHISAVEHEATDAFVGSTFAMYEDKDKGEALNDRNGSFAFVVPARVGREHEDYGPEVEPAIPLLRYLKNKDRAWAMRGLPPFIIDRYKPSKSGKQGSLVWAPVTEDMLNDLGRVSAGTATKAAQANVNDAVDFAINRLGVDVVGLGAVLPRITNMGKTVRQRFGDRAIVTTGHGGTLQLACDIIERFGAKFLGRDKDPAIAVIGLGAIGAAAAGIIADTQKGPVTVFDKVAKRIRGVVDERPDRITAASDMKSAIEKSDIIFSAVTSPIDLEELGFKEPTGWRRLFKGRFGIGRKPLEGKLIVDDSQPAAFSPEQAEKLGAKVLWVIGEDVSGRTVRESYDYGTMLTKADLFGCESEAAGLSEELEELVEKGMSREEAIKQVARIAITESVTTDSAAGIGVIFKKFGFEPAQPQAFGKAVEIGNDKVKWWKVAHAAVALTSLLIVNLAERRH